MVKSTVPKSIDDYDPQELIKELSDNLNQPDKFAEIFCTAAKKQKIIDDCLKEIIKNLLDKDSETRGHIKSIIAEHNKEDLTLIFKKTGLVLGSIFLLFIGALFHAICVKYI
jgi:hypothetical protein